jgi:hypothetical protein
MRHRRVWSVLGLVAALLLSACGSALSGESDTPGQTEQPELPTEVAAEASNTEPLAPTNSPEPATEVPLDTPVPTATENADVDEYEIITLLPFDAIPAIDDPDFYGIEQADQEYHPGELVIGVEVDGDARAYSVSLLSRHEIVNDEIGGHPISVTW